MQWPDISERDRCIAVKAAIREQFEKSQEEWNNLYNREEYFELREAIVQQLVDNSRK